MTPEDLIEIIKQHSVDIIAMHGLPGDGKTYLAERLAEASGLPLIGINQIAFEMYGRRKWYFAAGPERGEQREAVERMLVHRVKEGFLAGHPAVIVDRGNVRRGTFLATQRLGQGVFWIGTTCFDSAELFRRLEERDESRSFWLSVRSARLMRKDYVSFWNLPSPKVLIDTSPSFQRVHLFGNLSEVWAKAQS